MNATSSSNSTIQVHEVQEYYGDFVAIDAHHFTVPCPKNELLIATKTAMSSGTSSLE